MIIKIIENKAKEYNAAPCKTGATINYHTKKNEKGEDCAEVIDLNNTYARNTDELKGHLIAIEDSNKRVSDDNKTFHCVFSFAPSEEVINDEVMKSMIGDYMNKMGYENQPYGVFKHTDKSHLHFHIVSTRINAQTHKKINDSNENYKSKKLLTELTVKYGLKQLDELATQEGVKKSIDTNILMILKHKPHSLIEFNKFAAEYGCRIAKVKKGYIVYSNKTRKGFASSKFEPFKNKSFISIIKRNKYYRDRFINQIKIVLDDIKTNNEKISLTEFFKQIKAANIYAEVSKNNTGINGIVYKGHGFEIKGSEISKEYSWNVISELVIISSKKVQSTDEGVSDGIKRKKTKTSSDNSLANLIKISVNSNAPGISINLAKDEEEGEEEEEENIPRRTRKQ